MSGWVCQWKPFWIPVGESFQKAYLEEWIYMGDDSSDEQGMANFPRWCRVLVTKITSPNKSYLKKHLQHQDQRGSLMLFRGNLLGPRVLHPSGKELRHHCLLYDPGATSSTQSSSVLFLNAWSCRFQVKRSCQASKILSPRAQTSSHAWVKTDPHATLVRHVVYVSKSHCRFSRSIRKET